jgi:hypothetical protein
MSAAVRGIARVLEPCGRLWLAVVHPINSAERFETDAADAPFVIKRDYLSAFTYADMVERDGLSMTFHRLRPIESYFWRLRGQAYSSKLSESQAFRATRKSVRPANFCHPNKRDQRKQGRRGNWVGAFRAQLPCYLVGDERGRDSVGRGALHGDLSRGGTDRREAISLFHRNRAR